MLANFLMMLELENLSYSYVGSEHAALNNVSLSVPDGSFFALLGPNGAGKTTLLRIICGRIAGFSGKVCVNSKFCDIHGNVNRKRLGVLLENPGIYPKLSVEEYLSYFAFFYGFGENACMPGGILRSRVENLSKSLELPNLSCAMSTLSLGNRQKVQLVRAMQHNPKLLILDEPVANLDPIAREAVWSLIANWRSSEGGTAIVCSHVLAEMEAEATDYAIMCEGNVKCAGHVLDLGANNMFNVIAKGNVSAEIIRKTLVANGIDANVKLAHTGLSALFRETVSK